tara:strand:+ start:762 stop:878 length:117 start_codon:yes stop_codon:yes gene_type:complete
MIYKLKPLSKKTIKEIDNIIIKEIKKALNKKNRGKNEK